MTQPVAQENFNLLLFAIPTLCSRVELPMTACTGSIYILSYHATANEASGYL